MPLPADQTVCGRCIVSPLADYTLVPVLHEHYGAYLIKRLKFHQGEREAKALCGFMLTAIRLSYATEESLPDYLVPVPNRLQNHVEPRLQSSVLVGPTAWATAGHSDS